MKKTVIGLLLIASLLVAGCGTKEGESTSQTKTDAAAQPAGGQPTAEQQRYAVDLKMNPSGVRIEEMTVGTGNEIVKGSNVVFDYNCWTADGTGLVKRQGVGTSVGRPGQAFKCEVGVHPLPGLSDGVMGMRAGGSRRIFVPASLGFPAGHPMAGNNLIYEVIGIQEIAPEEVTHFQDSLTNRLVLIRHIQDSIQKATPDSLRDETKLDSLGNIIETAEGKQ